MWGADIVTLVLVVEDFTGGAAHTGPIVIHGDLAMGALGLDDTIVITIPGVAHGAILARARVDIVILNIPTLGHTDRTRVVSVVGGIGQSLEGETHGGTALDAGVVGGAGGARGDTASLGGIVRGSGGASTMGAAFRDIVHVGEGGVVRAVLHLNDVLHSLGGVQDIVLGGHGWGRGRGRGHIGESFVRPFETKEEDTYDDEDGET
jgi:hypothetical protein